MAVIIDTSCLVILAKIKKLELLELLVDDILIPQAVAREFGEPLPSFINIYPKPLDNKLLQFASAFLDPGESEVITLAVETKAEGVVIDEKKGRKVAQGLGLKVIGTLGLLGLGHRKGIIKDIEQIIGEVKACGFFISEQLLNEIIRK